MSAGQSQRSVASSTRRRQEAEFAVAEERERAAAQAAAAAERASRLAAAELAAARAEVEAAAAADAARAAAAEVEVLRGSNSSSISADDSADADLEPLEKEAARGRVAQWATAHAHERGGGPERRGRAGGAPGGDVHGGGVRVDGERGLHRRRGSLSPVRYRGHHEYQAVVRDVGPGGGWPTLTKTNYVEWAAVMRVKLQVRHMWDAVRYGDVDYDQDRRALDALIAAVPPEMQFSLTNKRTAKKAWDAIAAARIGSDRARKSTLQALRKEWENLAFKPGEDVDDFALRLNTLLQKLVQFGDDTYGEERAVEKLFRCVPEKYKQMARSIESLLDLSTMTIEEALGRLKVVDSDEPQRLSGPVTIGGKLLLTREQWAAGQGDRKKGEPSSTTGGRKRGKPRKDAQAGARGRAEGDDRGGAQGGAAGKQKPARDDSCHNCGKPGHWARDCRQPRRGQAHVAQAEEEEQPALFIAHASIELPPAAPAAAALLHLDEPKAHALLGDSSGNDKTDGWCLDTGATHHMTGRREFFSELDSGVRGTVKFGDASAVEIKGVGSVVFVAKTGEHRLLTGVYYIPALRNSIISLGQLDENGSRVEIEHGVLRIWDHSRRLLVKVNRSNRLYVLHAQVAQPLCLAARRDDDAWRWHERFGHLNFEALRQLGSKEMVRGMPHVDHVEQFCDTCVLTKLRRLPFPRQASFRAKEKLELVHGDLCGPVTPATPGGRRYFLLLVDDVSRYMWAVLLDVKASAADAIKCLQAAAEAECGRKLRVLRTDNGGEFTAAEFAAYCANEGIHRHFSAPYTPQQNGVVERRNQTVVATARALLKQRGMPAFYWGEAVMTAVHLLNRSPTKALDGKTPYEAWHGRKPAVSHLRVFGCLAFVKELNHVGKLDDRSTPGVFIGYTEGAKAYRVLDPTTRRVRITRDVVFDEGRGWTWDKMVDDGSTPTTSDFVVDYVHFEEAGGANSSSSPSSSTPPPRSPPPPASPSPPPPPAPASPQAPVSPPPAPPATPRSPTPAPTPSGSAPAASAHDEQHTVEFATPLSNDEDRIDAYHGGEPLRYRTMDDLLGEQPVPELAQRDLEAELHLAQDDGEPRSFAEAERNAAWRAAMQEEMDAVERNKMWELADLPAGHHAISLKWVFKLKKNEAGEVIKHKARLVARGFVQQEGVDFDDAFAPVARMESEGWCVHHMNVKSAFLNGDLKEEVYVRQPPGFIIPGKESKVLRLRKALYGLRQAPRAWNAKLDSTLKQMGFQQSAHEAAVYRQGKGGNALLIGVYVDDLVITGTKEKEIEAFKAEMKATFQMSDLGPLSFYLGIEVHQDSSGISLRQTAYAKRIVELGGLTDCNPAHTPMEERLKLSRESTAEEVDATQYRRIVGSLRYLVHTRPDLAFAVGYVSRFMQRPTTEHQQAVKRILRYVAGTSDYGLHYPRCPGAAHFIGYSDSDHAGDIDTSKSTSGILYFLGKCPISWQSVKQQVVALSSCEAEYIAATTASTQALWLARLLGDLLGRDAEAVELRVDSKSALALAKNPVFHERSKHIRVRYHFIRSCLDEGSVRANYINTQDQLADLLTKSLGRIKFQELRARIGMAQIPHKETHKT
uniref:PH01B019A14.9 protein n=1 Tax=Phyllostachys edulis TaxID=38705 RepID=L0P215_PHYED|nr:PH01B019A14.9 [Phyllostachys edulis]